MLNFIFKEGIRDFIATNLSDAFIHKEVGMLYYIVIIERERKITNKIILK